MTVEGILMLMFIAVIASLLVHKIRKAVSMDEQELTDAQKNVK